MKAIEKKRCWAQPHLCCLLIFFGLTHADINTYSLSVDSSDTGGELRRFWRSTGFCPPLPHEDAYKFDLSNDMTQNLAYIGAMPQGGIEQVRIHFLLELVSVSRFDESGKPVYNFTHLDSLIERLFTNGLRPGFEIMGNPSDIFTDFENTTQVYMWRDLVQQVAKRYIDEFGLGYVMTWNFETWNEPDCHDFNSNRLRTLKITVQGYLNYYDACWGGLKAASPLLRLGGPGEGCVHGLKVGQYPLGLYQHIAHGTDFFTKQSVTPLTYLSMHKKGSGSSEVIRQTELTSWMEILGLFPNLAHIPFYNDEGDPLVGWSKDQWWRADATYAAVVAKVIGQHQNIIIGEMSSLINFTLLSNDNGFLSYYPHQFTQRTLVARFQMNNTRPPHIQFIRKPVYAAMSLLSLLGEQQLGVNFTVSGKTVANDSQAGVLATVHYPKVKASADSWQMAVLMYNSDDTSPTVGNDSLKISLRVQPPSNASNLMMAYYKTALGVCDPYMIWREAGKPDYPSPTLLQRMRDAEGPCRLSLLPVNAGLLELPPLSFQLPEVSLLHICAQPQLVPDQTNGLDFVNITSGQVLITWSDHCVNSRCIKTYDVEYSPTTDGQFTKVNKQDSFVTAFVYSPQPTATGVSSDAAVSGYYRVRAVDYWGRPGQYSLPAQYPPTRGGTHRPKRHNRKCGV